jgi:superfamily II DNA or RNA helicase
MNQKRSKRGRKRRPRGATPSTGSYPLYRRSISHFQRSERELGAKCFEEDRVKLEIYNTRALAKVRGSESEETKEYRVGIDWARIAERRIHTYCECQRFAGGKFCRHIWAVLLTLGETGPEHQPPGKQRLGLRKDKAGSWKDLAPLADGSLVAPALGNSGATARSTAKKTDRKPTSRKRAASASGRRGRAAATSWRSHLTFLHEVLQSPGQLTVADAAAAARLEIQFEFAINSAATLSTSGLVLDIFQRSPGAPGQPGQLKRSSAGHDEIEQLLLPRGSHQELAEEPEGSLAVITELPVQQPRTKKSAKRRAEAGSQVRRLRLPHQLYGAVLPHLCRKGRLSWWDGRTLSSVRSLRWDSGLAWHLALHLRVNSKGLARISGALERGGDVVSIREPVLILAAADPMVSGADHSFVVFFDAIARLEFDRKRDLPWISFFRGGAELVISEQEIQEALSELLALPTLPRLDIPEELGLREQGSPPQPRLALEPSPMSPDSSFVAELSFDYGSLRVRAQDPRSSIVDFEDGTLLRRDLEREHQALVRLLELGLRAVEVAEEGVQGLELDPARLPEVLEALLAEGWIVEVQGRSVNPPNSPTLRIESGVDWFDLSGEIEFAGNRLELSNLIEAVSRGENLIELEDGSRGFLPKSWLETYDSLAKVSRDSTDSGLRFLSSQALIVDALLAAMPPANVDASFSKLRERLASFERIRPRKGPRSFVGTLRTYQQQGLGWLCFLREFGLGGVLADDMGLGKTVQVLAQILTYRAPSKTTKLPFLVVAPRSVVYNWIDEASRFAPKLRVVEYRGAGREELEGRFDEFDIVVTTYGTLRRHIDYLATVEFDTVILDEAQAIKNPGSQTAKASRLLVARHRLALTGTPIENHLSELGSIFQFLNPDLLGKLPRFEVLVAGRAPTKRELEQLADDLRPFILRRTKTEVLPDLPPKTEQVLFCDMRAEQRELYDRLRAGYQVSLLEQVESRGVTGSAVQVLEALLRLRQIACHPGLVDPEWEYAGSAKLEALFEQVTEILDEGHKVLVFSQFTGLLGFVRRLLDQEEMPYAYLDGQTRDRSEVVERFQTDPDCNLFLISLKAGGLGLNLTAAGYVFLLDPWWNPAVEAQAIDRSHRIGQTQPVFAYRMIARDTVEEKLLQMQQAKRDLAEAILSGEGKKSLRDLTADDLRMLLS